MSSRSLPEYRSSFIRPTRSSRARSRRAAVLLTLLTLLLLMWPCAIASYAAPTAQSAVHPSLGTIGQPRPQSTKPLDPGTLTSITVTPADSSIVVGITQQFTATGNYSDGSTQDFTNSATWTSSDTTVATISSSGLATALNSGSTTITASFDPGTGVVSGNTTLTVSPLVLTSITVTPANPSIVKGTTQQFTATGTFSDGSTQDLTGSVQWSSSSIGVATISSSGLATAVNTGSTTITATSGSVSGSTTLEVTAATLTSITLAPTNPSIPIGVTQQFVAIGHYSDGSTQDISSSVTWSSSDTTVATISSTGLATAVAAGTTTITATDTTSGINGTTTLTVTTATLVSIAVTPANPTIAKGTTQQFVATGTYSDGRTQDISSSVTWSSGNTTVATISSTGLATGVKTGITTIAATSGSVSGTTSLIVTAATLTSIALTPPNASISAGTTRQYIATGTYSDGRTQDISSSVTWRSSNPGVAPISDVSG
ncbi:MAG: Ig-like domain-containing protein, partial [Herpetosiphonaceae bacterium]|nr:Ig-like domain-containing protein [Herpetosiphonaceae bacterium]